MERQCAHCGKPFIGQRPTAKYCGSSCRGSAAKVRAANGGVTPEVSPGAPIERPVSGLVDAVKAELEVLGRVDSVIGQHALEVANRIVSAPGMNAGVAALSKELTRVMSEARQSSTVAANPLDELRARRDAKRRAG